MDPALQRPASPLLHLRCVQNTEANAGRLFTETIAGIKLADAVGGTVNRFGGQSQIKKFNERAAMRPRPPKLAGLRDEAEAEARNNAQDFLRKNRLFLTVDVTPRAQ